jgi:phage terminase large subunit GpA-like protein
VRDPRLMAVKGRGPWRSTDRHADGGGCHVSGKKLRRGIKVFSVAGGIAKLEFYNNLRKTPRWPRTV